MSIHLASDFSFSSFNDDDLNELQLDFDPNPEAQDDIPEDDELNELLEAEEDLKSTVRKQKRPITIDNFSVPTSDGDIREAIEQVKRERTEKHNKAGVVIQHRIPEGISVNFRSECDYPESPSKRYGVPPLTSEASFGLLSNADIPFLPSSQQLAVPPSSPPTSSTDFETPRKSRVEEMDNPFNFEEEDETITPKKNGGWDAGNPFQIEEDAAEGNPFNMEVEDDRPVAPAASSSGNGDKYEQAFNNPFTLEENLDEIPTPRLPASSIKASTTTSLFGKENEAPPPSTSADESNPFSFEEPDTTTTTNLPPPLLSQRPSQFSFPPALLSSAPKPNATSRVKVIFSNGEVSHLLQHPPNRLKVYRGSLVNHPGEDPEEGEEEQDLYSLNSNTTTRSRRKYYGIDIHHLKSQIRSDAEAAEAKASAETASLVPAVESMTLNALSHTTKLDKRGRKLLWTEKYRAKRFTDLLGDERTHRHILRWLKGWDSIVFGSQANKNVPAKLVLSDEQKARKILLITGPPGLGKTTTAHVLARQAGYEPLEINASDDRTAHVVRNRIKDVVGTETVHMGDAKRGKPVCVIIDEIDGVTGEGGGGDGGFIKALIDLIEQDRRNSGDPDTQGVVKRKGKKGSDRFRFLRPIIAVCNDLYAPSLRTLRPLCEVVYTRRPPLALVLGRLKDILEKEGVEGESDAVRRLVELEGGHGGNPAEFMAEWSGDVRGIMVAGEWICGRLRSAAMSPVLCKGLEMTNSKRIRMTKKWVEDEFSNGGGLGANDGTGSGGRGNGVREVVERVFLEEDLSNAQFQGKAGGKDKGITPGTSAKSRGIQRLRNLIEASGEFDKIMTDCFAKYPTHPFHDDPTLTKPNKAYEWMHMHDLLTSRVFGGSQDYELTPYLCTPLLGLHTLFATPAAATLKGRKTFGKKNFNPGGKDGEEEEATAFTGAKADFESREAQKANMSVLNQLLTTLPHSMVRGFKPVETIAYELAPWLVQIVQPKVNPVLVGGKDGPGVASVRREVEKKMVDRAVEVMAECNVGFEKFRVEGDSVGRGGGWLFRMEPPFDTLSNYKTFTQETPAVTTRYAVRQVLDQELRKFVILQQERIRQERFAAANPGVDIGLSADKAKKDKEKEKAKAAAKKAGVKRDFFGRVIDDDDAAGGGRKKRRKIMLGEKEEGMIWCTFREGFSNAVKKTISWEEFMAGL